MCLTDALLSTELHAGANKTSKSTQIHSHKKVQRSHFFLPTNEEFCAPTVDPVHTLTQARMKVENRQNQKVTDTYRIWRHYCKQSPKTICHRKHQHPFSKSISVPWARFFFKKKHGVRGIQCFDFGVFFLTQDHKKTWSGSHLGMACCYLTFLSASAWNRKGAADSSVSSC